MPKNRLAYTPSEVAGIAPATFSGYVYNPTIEFKHQDYDLLSRTVEAREARIDKANERKNAIDEALGKLEAQLHNDEETRTWFQNYKNSIQQDIANEINAGNYRSAIRLATDKASEMILNPEVQGRIKTNQQYQQIREEQRKLAGNNQELFEYWLDNNPYEHKNIKDETGKVISHKDYTPNFTLLGEANLTGLASAAFKIITPEKIAGSTTKDYTADSYSREWITEQQIKDNLGAILIDSGTSLAQIEQKYNYETYLLNKDKQILKEIEKELSLLSNSVNQTDIEKRDILEEEKALFKQKINKRESSLTRNGVPFNDIRDYAVSILSPIIKNMAYDYRTKHNTKKTPTNTSTNPFTNYLKDLDIRLGMNPQVKSIQVRVTGKGKTDTSSDNTPSEEIANW